LILSKKLHNINLYQTNNGKKFMAQKNKSFVSILENQGINLTEEQNALISTKIKPQSNLLKTLLSPFFRNASFQSKLDNFEATLYGIKNLLNANIITKDDVFKWIIDAYAEQNDITNFKFSYLSLIHSPLIFLEKEHNHLKIKEKVLNLLDPELSADEMSKFFEWLNSVLTTKTKHLDANIKSQVLDLTNQEKRQSIDDSYKYNPFVHKSIIEVLKANAINLTDEQSSEVAMLTDKKIFDQFLKEFSGINLLYKAKILSETNLTKWITKGYKDAGFKGIKSKYGKIAENADKFVELSKYKCFNFAENLERVFAGDGQIILAAGFEYKEIDLINLFVGELTNINSQIDKILSDKIISQHENNKKMSPSEVMLTESQEVQVSGDGPGE